MGILLNLIWTSLEKYLRINISICFWHVWNVVCLFFLFIWILAIDYMDFDWIQSIVSNKCQSTVYNVILVVLWFGSVQFGFVWIHFVWFSFVFGLVYLCIQYSSIIQSNLVVFLLPELPVCLCVCRFWFTDDKHSWWCFGNYYGFHLHICKWCVCVNVSCTMIKINMKYCKYKITQFTAVNSDCEWKMKYFLTTEKNDTRINLVIVICSLLAFFLLSNRFVAISLAPHIIHIFVEKLATFHNPLKIHSKQQNKTPSPICQAHFT